MVQRPAIRTRQLRFGERQPVLDVFEGLSERSRRLRFHGPKPRLPERDLDLLVDVGRRGREAVIAVEATTGRSIGIARFSRGDDDRQSAEVAFAVVDDWQRRGLGRLLLGELVPLALAAGISRFRASVAPGNEAALALLRRVGRVVAAEFVDGVHELQVELASQERLAA